VHFLLATTTSVNVPSARDTPMCLPVVPQARRKLAGCRESWSGSKYFSVTWSRPWIMDGRGTPSLSPCAFWFMTITLS